MSRLRKIKPSHYTSLNRVRLIKGGLSYFSLLKEVIDGARQTIYLQYYIFEDDETGIEVITALRAAVQRGVAVFLHIDAYASQGLSKQVIADMKAAGIYVKRFQPLLRSRNFYFGRRLHHKVVVADGIRSLVGGVNVSNRYNDMPGEPAWLDMALYCEGEAPLTLQLICRELWGSKRSLPATDPALVQAFCSQIPESEQTTVRVRRNDWVKRKNEITGSYIEMLGRAQNNITIMCSYFLPGNMIRRKMLQAVKKGVKVRVILAGNSDVMVAKHAERYLYNWLLNNHITIYEYQDSVLHAKLAVYDHAWTTIGSYNLNNISAYASLELNIDVKNDSFAAFTEKTLDEIISKQCKLITKENYTASTGFLRKLWQQICYRFIKISLNLFTFYFKQEE